MRAVIQRVTKASVSIEGKVKGEIDKGLLILLGVGREDTKADADILARKIATMRIFSDENDKVNLSVKDVNGSLLIISNFTLYGDMKRGTRPSFDPAMPPKEARELYEYFCKEMEKQELFVATGEFGADMKVSSLNDGPVTIFLDTIIWSK